ncbi:MAG: wax ester/triacylglycerol synthase family O-acyltransferase [Thermodesulfobacteriota bacterium]
MSAAELPRTELSAGGGDERLSELDEAFLYLERPNQPMHIGCIAEIEGRLTLDELLEILNARLVPLRRFRQRPVRSLLHLRGVRWEDDPDFDLRRHVRHVALPPPGDEEQLQHVVETLFSPQLPPDRPLWEIHLVDGVPPGRSALLCKVHHCLTDGISGLGVLEAIADPPRGGNGRGRASRVEREPVERTGGPGPRDALRALLDPASALGRARDVASALDAIASFVQTPVPALPWNGRLGHGRRMLWRSFPLAELDSLRVAGDCTINDAVLAIVSGALRSYLRECGAAADEARVRALVPVSVRGDAATGALGNVLTALFPWLPVDVADPIERLARVRDEMRALKSREMGRATGVLLALLGALPSAVEAALLRLAPDTPLVSVGCTNVRGPRHALELGGRRIVEIHPVMNLFQGVGLAFAVASYAGRMSVCVSTDPRLVPDGQVVLDAVEASLYELRRAHWSRSSALRLARRLAEQPRVADVMQRVVATVSPGDPLRRARELIRKEGARHVPVVDDRLRVLRVLTEADLRVDGDARQASCGEAEPSHGVARAVEHLAPHDSALDAVRRMAERCVDALPVLDDGGRFLGLFTQEVFLRWSTARGPDEG